MAPAISIKHRGDLLFMVVLFLILLGSLFALAGSHNNIERFGDFYIWLLGLNAVGLLIILGRISILTWGLISRLRRGVEGTRLTLKVLVMFILVSLLPVAIVYAFSQNFLRNAIDSWFDTPVEAALNNALNLSRDALNLQILTAQRITSNLSQSFYDISSDAAVLLTDELRQEWDLLELTLLTTGNEVIASSTAEYMNLKPSHANNEGILQVRQGVTYAEFNIDDQTGAHIIIVVPVFPFSAVTQNRMLLAIFPYSNRIGTLAEDVQNSFSGYRKLEFLRNSLKWTYSLTLTLVLLFTALMSVWLAFYLSRRLILPIQNLAKGTRAVAGGDLSTRLPSSGRDELSFLVSSFNQMIQHLATARTKAQSDQLLIENQRAYLSTVLEHISSGVIALNAAGEVRTVNTKAGEILEVDTARLLHRSLRDCCENNPLVDQFHSAITPHIAKTNTSEWHDQFEIIDSQGKHKLIRCRGAQLIEKIEVNSGWVLVFEDVTAMIRAQREAAWGEVAQRLAHEIKNPLTPIQLSAERLRHKLLDKMPPEDAKVLERSTHTIVQQVEGMKSMVRAFADYASTPAAAFTPLSLNQLIDEVADLYTGMQGILKIRLVLTPDLPYISADANRIRQVLHNVIKNALESRKDTRREVTVTVSTRRCNKPSTSHQILLTIEDDGPGFPDDLLDKLFEPYVTSKAKGSGLGLAIVKKIIEEHGGNIHAYNKEGGACLEIRLPFVKKQTMDLQGDTV